MNRSSVEFTLPSRVPSTLLCVSNFASNTGYAWDFIEALYAHVANTLAPRGIRTLVAYPRLNGAPRSLADSVAEPVELDFGFDSFKKIRRTVEFVRSNHVRTLYLTDRASCSIHYAMLRLIGVRHIVVHDHSSGERTVPHGLRRAAKWLFIRIPGLAADTIVAVSEYVATRVIETISAPRSRVVKVWNGIPLPSRATCSDTLRFLADVNESYKLVVCCCRAHHVKGVHHLLRAFDVAIQQVPVSERKAVLIYIGDGPQYKELEEIRSTLASRDRIIFLGYREDSAELLAEANICVVPSVWQDAFPLGVLEPMAAAKPVIATSVGGIPEMIEDGVTGLLVPPGDEQALADALTTLFRNPSLAASLGAAASKRVAERFTPRQQREALVEIIARGFPRSKSH